ncbi:MAG: peptidoglycan-associated lipoprotein Pal [Acidobacteria bacterium]|jgi:peptidoglycan-associated lipoprotein|nr:peptidoglycan-associated lipoprotein Pal [Acidobacteriota bacterium]
MNVPALRKMTVLAIALAFGAAGCHKKASAPPPYTAPEVPATPAPTATISAEPPAIDLGQSVVLNWRTTNATSVSIDGIGAVNVNGTQTVTPSSSTNFHLVARGDGGSAEANVRVTVRVPETPAAPTGNADMGSDAEFARNVQDIFFDYDSYDVRTDAQSSITASASYLAAHPAIKVVIGGYCDERGSAEYNLALGENRANAAKTALVNAGIAPSRMRVISYGKEKQFCTEQTESCWQQNRRAQFSLDR